MPVRIDIENGEKKVGQVAEDKFRLLKYPESQA